MPRWVTIPTYIRDFITKHYSYSEVARATGLNRVTVRKAVKGDRVWGRNADTLRQFHADNTD